MLERSATGGRSETIVFALLLICGPWIAFTTWYYGGPLPHTILAKAWGFGDHWYAGLSALGIASKLWSRLLYIFAILGPAYGGNGTGYAHFSFDPHGTISCVVLLFAVIGAISALRSKSLPAHGDRRLLPRLLGVLPVLWWELSRCGIASPWPP